ncbi:MAG TPA: filamentous hemagglutinin N-terminal domain-containing protein [Frateuria sp.]|uniref:two-partner secretion domain-containing protein n=1 Tax=Frateuria sp. TaxID=2211372 RepID=UPI002DE65117|nr:filamentous hemagglutinin N-terminal domain-containing protein [Frateuria sp.]
MNNGTVRKAKGVPAATVSWQRSLRRHALWAALTLALGVPTVQAQTVAEGGTHTSVIAAPNGVPVVNIAAPNGAGVSHNTYQQFNVGSNGLILNNSGSVSNTQLAGYIGGNPNLGANQAASLIINEVISTAPSQLNGAMEVAGRAAQVVVANPNGISCSGCGFINAPRGTLTTGKPLFAGDGSLGGFAVSGGTITVEGQGLPSGSTDRVDLLARVVAINAGVWARQLNVVTGPNRVDFTTLATQPLSATGATPSAALDVSALGGMYANAIRLVGTEAGLGINSQGEIIAQNGNLTLTSAGQVVLAGKTTATGDATVAAAQSLTNQGSLAAGGSVTLGSGDFTNQGVLYGNNAITLSANGALSNSGQIEAQNGTVTLASTGAFDNAASGSLYAGGTLGLTATSLTNAGILESAHGALLQLGGAANNSGTLQLDAGDLVVHAATIGNAGTLSVGGNATLDATTSLSSTTTLLAGGQLTLTAPQLVTAGTVQAGGALTLSGDTLTNSGKLYALGGAWTATLGGAFVNQTSGDVYAGQGLAVQAASLANAGSLEAQQVGTLTLIGALGNSGKLQSDQADLVLSAASLSNAGTASAFGHLQWQVRAAAQNSGVLVSGQAMNVSSGSFDNQAGAQIQSGTDLALSATTLANEGTINAKGNAALSGVTLNNAATGQVLATGTLTVGETGSVGNAGVLQAGSDFTLTQAASLTNAANATLYAGQDFNLALGQALTNAGMLYAARTSTLSVGSVGNTGTLRSGGTLSLTSAGDVVSSGAIQAQQSVSLLGGADVTTSGKLYAIDGGLTVQATGAFSSASAGDIYGGQDIGFQVGSFANAGRLEATQSVNLLAQGSASNSGDLQADHGNLVIAGGALSNHGTLSAANATQLTSAGSLGNSGKLVTGQTLAITAGSFTNSGQIQSGGAATLQSAGIVNSGLLQAGSNLAISHNATLANQSGGSLLAAGDVDADTSSLLTNGGVIQAGGSLAIDGSGAISNAAGATLYGTQLVNLQLGGGLSNAGTVYGAQGVNLTAASLDNSGSLRSGAALGVTTQNGATNSGATYALGLATWNVGGALANAGVLAADGNVTVQAASVSGNGTVAAGLQGDGSLGATGDLSVTTTGKLAAGGRSLAAGNLVFAGSTVDLSGSQTRASNITLTASQGNVTNAGGDLAANGTVAIATQASLVNGGTAAAQGGKISAGTLVLQAAALDNRYGSLTQTGASDLALSLAGAFANANGTLATNAHNLSLRAAAIDNSAGTIQDAGNGTLDLATTDNLTNTGGKIAGNGALTLQANGVLGNDGGLLSVAGNVSANAGSFDNVHGTLIGQNLDLIIAQALTNTGGGTIQAGGALQLDAGSVDNTASYIKVTDAQPLTLTTTGALTNGAGGFIGGNGAATVNAGSLVNAGQIYAGGTLGVTTQGQLTNDGGALQAQGTASIVSGGGLSNRGGRIEAGSGNSAAGLSVRAASLDNTAGRIANAGQGASTFAMEQSATNRGGTLGGQGAVTLSAGSLDNSQAGKLVAGQALTLALGSLNNTFGSVYAASDLGWANGGASFLNAQGSLQAGGNLALDLASLDNAGGTVATNQSGTLSLGSFTGLGKVAAGQDLSLTLEGSYTNVTGSQLSANRNLTLNVSGNFSNAAGATLQAVNQLAVNAANIDNAVGATLNGASTVLATGGALTNEGSIEGNTITLNAGSLTNTANIIGGSITATAGSLTNGADLGTTTGNNPYQSALIAAANGMNLYVSGTLLNRDATIFTLGNLAIGANASGGASQAVTNRSGDIEADGGITINANQFTNERRTVNTSTYTLTPAEQANNTSTTTSTFDWTTDPNAVAWCANYATTTGANGHAVRCGPMGYYGDSGHETLTEQVQSVNRLLSASAQSKLVSGGDITLNGSVMNNASVVAAGNNLVVNGQNGSNGGGSTAHATVQNIAWAPTALVQSNDVRAVDGDYQGSRWYSNRESNQPPMVYWTGTSTSIIALDPFGNNGWITVAPGAGLSATMSAGNTVSIIAHTINNATVGANGQPVQGAIGLGGNSAGQFVAGSGAEVVGSASGTGGSVGGVAVGTAPGQASGGSLALATAHAVTSTPVSSASASPSSLAAPQVVATLIGPNANVRLPQTGLYTINVQPGSQFLVETNPQFTQYNNFISSNYLLQQLGLNPAQTQQRLGDGFYEQQQVLDQITSLTGRRYLADNTDALDQYRDLMNNATQVAKQFDLSVGVALTPAQMASLTQDIVWLVNVTVDGHQVLEPVVYLSAADAKNLAASGATIAGKNVILTASGDVTNNGTIAASQNAQLTASNLLNSGTISAGNDLSINAAQNILNGGTISAGGNVSLVAGNDVLSGVNVSQSLGTVNMTGLNAPVSAVALTTIGPGSITAGGNLAISAGRDISLDTAPVAAGSNLSLAAGRDLIATATAIRAGGDARLLAGRDLTLNATSHTGGISDAAHATVDATHTVSTVGAGGTLVVAAGRDLASQGAQFNAGNQLGVSAGRDVTLNAVNDNQFTGSGQESGRHFATQTQSDDTLRGTTLSGANGVSVVAGRDITTTAATISSAHGAVLINAGRDVNLLAGEEDHSTSHDTSATSSGHTYGTKTVITHDATSDSFAKGTTISGQAGIEVDAGHNLLGVGTTLRSGAGNIGLSAGGQVALLASSDTHTTEHSQQTRESGFEFIPNPHQGTRKNDTQTQQVTANGSTLDAAGSIAVVNGGDQTYQAANVHSGANTSLVSGGQITLATATNSNSYSRTSSKHNVAYQAQDNRGQITTTEQQSTFTGGGSLNVAASNGVVVQYGQHAGETQAQAITRITHNAPGTDWMNVLQNNPKTTWQGITEQDQSWHQHHEGLTPAAGAVVTIVAAYFTAGAASAWIGDAAGATAGSGTAFAAAGTGATGAAVSAGWANATLAGAAAGSASGGVGAAAQGNDWRTPALYGGITGGFTGYLSAGTYYNNPINGAKQLGSYIASGNTDALGEFALKYAAADAAGRVETRLASDLGLNGAQLNWLLMAGSIIGNQLGDVGSRYRTPTPTAQKPDGEPSFDTTNNTGVVGILNRKNALLGLPFDAIDILLGYQGLPDASGADALYNVNSNGVNQSPAPKLTCHSLGTITCSYLGWNGTQNTTLASIPFGVVAPPDASVFIGNGDAVNGFYGGQLFNWNATVVTIPFIVGHPFENYKIYVDKGANSGK